MRWVEVTVKVNISDGMCPEVKGAGRQQLPSSKCRVSVINYSEISIGLELTRDVPRTLE